MFDRFRMKCFTSQFGDSKVLVKRIMTAHQNSNEKWLYLKDLDCGDKRANIGLLLHGKQSCCTVLGVFLWLTDPYMGN